MHTPFVITRQMRPAASRRVSLRGLPGVCLSGACATIEQGIYTPEQTVALKQHLGGQPFQSVIRSRTIRLAATGADMDTINRGSQRALAADDVVVFERVSSNDLLTSKLTRFTKKALDKFAADFGAGRGVHGQVALGGFGHSGNVTLGKTFAADVRKDTVHEIEANWLFLRFFVVRKDATPQRLQLISDLETGILGFDSITADGGRWEFIQVEGDTQTVSYFLIDDDEDAVPRLQAIELSVLSELGAVAGAGAS